MRMRQKNKAHRHINVLTLGRRGRQSQIGVVFWNGGILDIIRHLNATRYPNQRVIVLDMEGYAYLIPFYGARRLMVSENDHPWRESERRAPEMSKHIAQIRIREVEER